MRQIPRNSSIRVSSSIFPHFSFFVSVHFFSAQVHILKVHWCKMHSVWLVKCATTHVHIPANTLWSFVRSLKLDSFSEPVCWSHCSWFQRKTHKHNSLKSSPTLVFSHLMTTHKPHFPWSLHKDWNGLTFVKTDSGRQEIESLRRLFATSGQSSSVLSDHMWRWLRVRWYCWPLMLVNW